MARIAPTNLFQSPILIAMHLNNLVMKQVELGWPKLLILNKCNIIQKMLVSTRARTFFFAKCNLEKTSSYALQNKLNSTQSRGREVEISRHDVWHLVTRDQIEIPVLPQWKVVQHCIDVVSPPLTKPSNPTDLLLGNADRMTRKSSRPYTRWLALQR